MKLVNNNFSHFDSIVPKMATNRQPNQNDSDFASLLAAVRCGDEAAVDELWEQCRKYLLKIAGQDLQPELLQKFGASDVVQQSIMIANQKLPQFNGNTKGEFLAWIKQIMAFESRQSSRRFQQTDKRAIHLERSINQDSRSINPEIQVSDPFLTPGTQAASDEQAELVKRALLLLVPLQRQVIQLRNWEELTFEEIGKRVGKSDEAVRKIWVRAIARLELELKRMNAI